MLVTKNNETNIQPHQVVVAGVGGTGLHVLDRLVLRGLQEVRMLAVDTDSRMLGSSVVEEKIQLGRKLTRGLDSGGDPEVGSRAALESSGEFLEALADANLLFLIAGLGGGTGTGALPQLARLAAEKGAKIVSLVTLPFEFEGRRRIQQAQAGVDELVGVSDVIYVLPNDAVIEFSGDGGSVFEAFEVSDDVLGQISRGLCHMLARKGFLSVDWAELVRLFEPSVREPGRSCWIGWGEDATENRARAVVEMILSGPFLSRTEIREKTDDVLVSITGGSNMLFSEVEYVVRELREAFPHDAKLRLATRLDEERGDDLSVLVIAAKTTLGQLPGMPSKNKTEILPASLRRKHETATDFAASEKTAPSNSLSPPVSEGLDFPGLSSPENEPQRRQNEQEEIQQNKNYSETEKPESVVSDKPQFEPDLYSETPLADYPPASTKEPEIPLRDHEEQELIRADAIPQAAYLFMPSQNEPLTQSNKKDTFPAKPDKAQVVDIAEQHSELPDASPDFPQDSISPTPTEPLPTYEEQTLVSTQKDVRSPAEKEPDLELFSNITSGEQTKKLPKVELAAIPHPLKIFHSPENTKIVRPTAPETHPASDKPPPTAKQQAQKLQQAAETVQPGSVDTYFTREPEVTEPATAAINEARQETLQFETVSLGRFEKTDATLHNGENLDIPTYLRKQFHIRQVIE